MLHCPLSLGFLIYEMNRQIGHKNFMKAISVSPIETLRDGLVYNELQRDSVIIPFYAILVGVTVTTEKGAR